MISKEEYLEWRQNKVTQKLVELITIGRITAIEDLEGMRGEVGDFPRGGSHALGEVLEYIKTGEGLYSDD